MVLPVRPLPLCLLVVCPLEGHERTPNQAPVAAQAFASGKLTIQKTDKPFSSIALYKAHQQMNATVKGEGGAIDLTESLNAFERWTTAGPEVA